MVICFCKQGNLQQANVFYFQVIQKGWVLGSATYDALIQEHLLQKMLPEAFSFIDYMIVNGLVPCVVTFKG
jgi:pentatricopeptide repeat protein